MTHLHAPAKLPPPLPSTTRHMVEVGTYAYPMEIGEGCLEAFGERIAALEPDRVVVVTDETVWSLYGERLRQGLERHVPVLPLVGVANETSKSLAHFERCAEHALEWGVTRRSVVVTLGGGVPGNLGGLLAAMLFRGIRLAHVPTTLMAILDSTLSLKQAINSRRVKNVLGAYHPPQMVLVDAAVTSTLDATAIRSGLCEMAKNALAVRPATCSRLEALLGAPGEPIYAPSRLPSLLELAIEAKVGVMHDDPYERSAGILLEYGHTLGHAIELIDLDRDPTRSISHGEAVGLGMLAAAEVARVLGLGSEELHAAHHRLLGRVGAPTVLPASCEPEAVVRACGRDTKRGFLDGPADAIPMVLLRDFGVPAAAPGARLHPVPRTLVEQVLCGMVGSPSGRAPVMPVLAAS